MSEQCCGTCRLWVNSDPDDGLCRWLPGNFLPFWTAPFEVRRTMRTDGEGCAAFEPKHTPDTRAEQEGT